MNTDKSEKLKEAQHKIHALEREIEQLKSRNANLAEDVLRLSSSAASNSGAGGSGGGNGGVYASSGGLMTSLDKEELKAAENRAASAEKEASTLRNELLAAADRESEAQRAAQRAVTDANAAKAAAARIETELQDLSAAYATLDSHTNSLQQRIDELELQRGGGGGGGQLLDGYVAKEEAEAAAIKAANEAREEADASMEDLLVCLGEEEAKVAVLAAKLEELGVSSDLVLSALG
jgi:chromosome segregation ATPase